VHPAIVLTHLTGDQEAVCQGGSQISGVGCPKERCTLLKRYVFSLRGDPSPAAVTNQTPLVGFMLFFLGG